MPRKTYGANRRRPGENGSLTERLEQELRPFIPEWQKRNAEERANRKRNRPVGER